MLNDFGTFDQERQRRDQEQRPILIGPANRTTTIDPHTLMDSFNPPIQDQFIFISVMMTTIE
jgi:hypothetical protein